MKDPDASGMNDEELQQEYDRLRARLSKDKGRDPEGYRRLEELGGEIDRRRRESRREYFRSLKAETESLAPMGMECYICGRSVEDFNDFVRRNAETDFGSIMENDGRLRLLDEIHSKSVPTERERKVMREFLDGCSKASRDISFALGNKDYLFVLMDPGFLDRFSSWDIGKYRSAALEGFALTAYENDVLGAFFSAFGDGMTVGEYVRSMKDLTERFRAMSSAEDDRDSFRDTLREKYVADNTVDCFETGFFGGMRIFLCPVCNGILETISATEDRIRRSMGKP